MLTGMLLKNYGLRGRKMGALVDNEWEDKIKKVDEKIDAGYKEIRKLDEKPAEKPKEKEK